MPQSKLHSMFFCSGLDELHSEVENLISLSVAPTTRKAYDSAMRSFNEFCSQHKIIKDKYSTTTLELFVTSLPQKGMQSGSIRSILSGIRHYCISHSIDLNFGNPRLALILKGIQRSNSRQQNRPKNAVRIHHLKRICSAASVIFDSDLACKVKAIFTLAFFAMLRPSEVAHTATTPQHQLKRSSIIMKANSVKIKFSSFKHSQGDCTVKILPQSFEVCPWRHLQEYLVRTGCKAINDPLFDCSVNEAASLLSQCIVHAGVKSRLTLHSFRRGGATWYSEQGVTDAKLKALGRWNSNAYLKYVKP